MTDLTVLRQAIVAAADIMVEEPVGLPPIPSATSLCRNLGLGASTFHRLFGNTEQFQRDFLTWHATDSYTDRSVAVIEGMANRDDNEEEATRRPSILASIADLAESYWSDADDRVTPEALTYPWLTNHAAREPTLKGTARDLDLEAHIAVEFLSSLGLSPDVAAEIAAPLVASIAASNLAARLVAGSNGLYWPMPELDERRSTLQMTFARTAATIIESYLTDHLENGAVDDTAHA